MSDLAHIPALPETSAPLLPRASLKRHLAAAILSAVIPGAGQLFLGRKKRAAALFIALVALSSGFFFLRLPRTYTGVIFLIWMCLLLSLFAVFDALLARDALSRARVSRWWILAGIPIHYISVNLIFTSLLIGSGFRTMKNASSSMEPTISLGDKLMVDRRYYQHHPAGRLDLALIRRSDALFVIKRITAVGGDTIEGKEQKIFLNGQLQDEPFIEHKFKSGTDSALDTFGPVAVPDGKFFVMGDNRDVSLDSRTAEFGLVDATAIVGRPIYGYRIIGKPLSWDLN